MGVGAMSVGSGNGPKTRLELTWIGKDERPRLEPRILLPKAEFGHATGTPADGGIHDNILIQGDNLLALKALEQEFAGKVRCAFIDPPYNTGSAFEQYDDGLEHSLWLSLMRDRLEFLRRLLSDIGTVWITIDDNEAHYLKVVCDEVFGRSNYVTSVVWEKDKGRRSDTVFSTSHDYILIYAKNLTSWAPTRNLLERSADQISRYRNPDGDRRGPWLQGDNSTAKSSSEGSRFPITLPSGRVVTPTPSRGWSFSRETYDRAVAEGRVYYGVGGDSMPIIKRYLSEVQGGVVPRTWWPADEAGHNQEAKRDHLNKLLVGIEPFPTPKPERLLQRVLEIATNPGDLVLDSFAGSGTTGAVAHKMGRRWIMVELGDHATTHIVPRLKKVIDGEDSGGVTEAVGWQGGGGYRFYRLAPSLIEEDQYGQKVISKQYNPAMLAEAMCKHMGFTYAPSQDPALYWQHGDATERDFIYVTTQSLTYDALMALSMEVGAERTLLVCCKAFRARLSDFPNLTVKKIPQAVLENCEWGRDDYSLNIAKPSGDDAPGVEDDPDGGGGDGNGGDEPAAPRRARRSAAASAAEQVQAAPVKKAPLKMDGTTRTPRAPKAPPVLPVPSSPAPTAVALNGKHVNGGDHATTAKSPKGKSTTKASAGPAPVAPSLLPPPVKVNRHHPGGEAKTGGSKAKGKKASPNGDHANRADGQAKTKKAAASPGRRRKLTDEKQGELL
jgi:adenine-specific DNA-methyltransferase